MLLNKVKSDVYKFIHWYSINARKKRLNNILGWVFIIGTQLVLMGLTLLVDTFLIKIDDMFYIIELFALIPLIRFRKESISTKIEHIPEYLIKNYEIKIEEGICTITEIFCNNKKKDQNKVVRRGDYFSFNIRQISSIIYSPKCKQIEILGKISHHRVFHHDFHQQCPELSIDLNYVVFADVYDHDLVRFLSDKVCMVKEVPVDECTHSFEALNAEIKEKYEKELDKADVTFEHKGYMNTNFFFRSSFSLYARYISIFFGILSIIFLILDSKMALVPVSLILLYAAGWCIYSLQRFIKFRRYKVHQLSITFNELRDHCVFKYIAHRYVLSFSFSLKDIKKIYYHTASQNIRFIVNANICCEVAPNVERKKYESDKNEFLCKYPCVIIPNFAAEEIMNYLNINIKPVKRTWVGCNDWFWYSSSLIIKKMFKHDELNK